MDQKRAAYSAVVFAGEICIDFIVKTDFSRIHVLATCILYTCESEKQVRVVFRMGAAE